jgi:hypothetical protein
MACLVCPEEGPLPNNHQANQDIGMCSLMANDLLLPFAPSSTDDTLMKLANVFPFVDYVSSDQYPYDIARTQMMFEDICHISDLAQRADYLDLSQLFANAHGMSINECSDLVYGLFTKVHSVNWQQFESSPDCLFL